MVKALFKEARSGHRHKRRAYRGIEKNAEHFVVTREEWTEIQEVCAYERRENGQGLVKR